MQVIPVVDIAAGVVVRAVRGQRDRYQPIASTLCSGSDPMSVGAALVDHCDSRVLYVADLDALRGGAPQYKLIRQLAGALRGVAVWLDAGFHGADDALEMNHALGTLAARVVTPVFGTESIASRAQARRAFADRDRSILSLDRMHDAAVDRSGCWTAPEVWPQRVIVMTLDRVGSGEGPDFATYRAVKAIAPPRVSLIGAGGIRDAGDLRAAAAEGATAWLVASALHDGRIARTTPGAAL